MKKLLIVFLTLVFMCACLDMKSYQIHNKNFREISEASGLTQFLKDVGFDVKKRYLKQTEKMEIIVNEYPKRMYVMFKVIAPIVPEHLKCSINLESDKRGNAKRLSIKINGRVLEWQRSYNKYSGYERLGEIARKIFELTFLEEG